MAGITINGKPLKINSNQTKKAGVTITKNKDTQNTLEYDGIKFGTVTNSGLYAIENNTLDSYTPATKEERNAIASYTAYKSRKESEAEKEKSEKQKSALLGASDKIAEKYPINTAKVPSSTEETKAETKGEKYTDRNYLAKPIVDRGLPDFSQKHNTAFGDVEINSSHINPTLSGEQVGVWLYNNALKRYDIKEEKFDINALDNWAKKNNFEPITNDKGFVTSYKPTDNTSEQAKKDYQMLWNLATTNSKRKYEENADKTVFQMGAFKDGYDFGDVTKATLSTVGDAGIGVTKGVFRLTEGLVDLGAYGVYGVSKVIGADKFAESVKKEAQADSTSLMFGGVDKFLDKNSLLGDYADAVAEGLGYVGGIMLTGGIGAGAGLGTLGNTVLTSAVTGASSMGGGMSEAYQNKATDGQAVSYGAMKGVIDAGTELLFGGLGKSVKALGISKGIGGLDDMFAKKLSSKIVSKIANENVQRLLGNTLEYTIKAGGEGFEELLAGLGTAVAKDLTYKSKEELSQLIKDENLLEQFVIGSVISFISQSPDFVKSIKNNTDFVSGFTKEVELEINEAYETLISEAESNGQKLSKKDKAKIYDKVVENAQGIIIASALAKAMSAETENSVSVDTNTPSVNTVKTNTETTPTVVDPSTLNQGKVDTTSVATSDSIPVTTPTVTETQPTPTVESVQTMPETAEATPTTKGVTSAYTNNNEKIDLKYKVVSLDDLIVSNNADGTVNPNYPQILQPRERTRQASILQVQNIANNLVPEKLGESTNVSDGSPIVGSDNVVESGNGRTMALSLVYKSNPEGAKKYIEFIKANADKFGIDATNLPKNPVLVRERITDVDRVEFVKQANESNLSAMSATELAKSDAERLTSDILNLLVANDDGNINTAENRAFVGRVISNVFSQNDLNSVVGANGMLSANGLERIRNALFYKAYNDVSLASKLSESLDNDIKNITNVLVNIAPKIVQIKNGIANGDLYDLDFSQDIVDGINYLQEAKRQNLKVKDFANQLTMGDDVSSIVKGIAYLFEQKNRGAKQATLFFNHLCDTILSKDKNQLTFLGEAKAPTKEEVLYEATDRYNNDEQGTGISFSEVLVSQRSEEPRQVNDTGRIGDNVENTAEQGTNDSESNGTSKQQGYVKEETVVGGDESTSRQGDSGTEVSRPENSRNDTEVESGELSYDDFTLDKTKNTKTQEDIWVIRPKEKVENFTELKAKMKAIGGYYSPYPTTPHGKGGFVFKTDPSHLFGNTQNASNTIETTTNQTQKTNKEEVNNGRGKEIPDSSDAEGRGGVAEKDSRGEGSNRERLSRKIQEILRKSSADRNNDRTEGHTTGRLEQKESAEEFEERVVSEGYTHLIVNGKSIAYKNAPKSDWNENAKEAAETIADFGVTVIVTEGVFLSNKKGVTYISDQAATVGTGEYLTVFISSKLDVDGMETAYHEVFHALRRIGSVKNIKHHYQMIDIISDGVNVDSESFEKFVSFLNEAYSHNVANITPKQFLEEVAEEFYAWYIGSVYANKNEHGVDMLSLIKRFSDIDSIKPQLDAVYEQIKSEATEETPTQNAQNTPKSSENVSGEETPAETKKVATEQNTGEIEDKATEDIPTKSKGTTQIADYVSNKLTKGEKITALELAKISSEAFGGTMADNTYTIKDVYDAMELGVNRYILSMEDVSAQKMLELLELLPTQTKRTEEQVKFQQFSTPPSIAYLANYVANVNAKDVMLEPSAGIGGIAVFAKREGATVYVNELDNRRLGVLKNMPFDRFFNENAEQLDNILGGKIEPTVIVMNPPFSSSSERNIHNTKIGAKHIEEALKILAPNGRLVAIVGHGMADDKPAFRDWWKGIKSEYNVRANIRIDGKNYSKYGTNFDIQMLVIDKNGATTHTETGSVDTLQELQEKLESIREERPNVESSRKVEVNKGTEQKPSERTRKEASRTGEATDVGIKSVSGADSITDTRKSADKPRPSGKSDAEVLHTTDGDGGRVNKQAPENTDGLDGGQRLDGRGERGKHTELRDGGRTDISDSGQHIEQHNVDRSDGNVRDGQNNTGVQRRRRTELTESIFEQYQPQPLKVENAKPHPAKVSESAAMSAITPPPITYKPNLPQDIVEKGVVSDVQLEAISYAGQCHSQTLANGTTRGFFLGDGTGIGKGRTIAGMILDNYNQGHKKAVWVTLNSSLVNDAKRDVKALFGNSDLVVPFEGGKKATKILSKDEAILVVGYQTLSIGYDQKGSNFEKIVDWLGKDFDGLIVFDEAHKMANATGSKGTRGKTKPSQTGLAGVELQKVLPKAKIVYSSATGATEVENLRYAERLGLWGEGTSFVTGEDFVSKIKAGGLASMELIARDMKAMGVYLSRSISYDDVKYEKITHKLTSQQVKIYDELARSWQIVLKNINKALETTNQGKDGKKRGDVLGAFWGTQQRFFNQILTSMQVPSVIADIEKQLADGNSCVIQLVSTNESAQNEELERIKSNDLELDDFDLTPKQMLMAMIEKAFPVEQYEEYEDENGHKKSKPVYDSNGNKVLNREAVKQRDDLLDKLGSIKVPSSPIDMIINHFGTDLVAENTGRSRRVVQKNGKTIEENIANKKDADVDAFQNGNKRIIIFSKAGGTGKSYHADKSAKNQQQRIHYLLEAGWQADNAVQGFGRTHRSNQVSAPIFKLVTTDLKGQMRFISTIAKRLDQLGAMTKGQRQAGSQGMFSASDNLENTLASDVLAVFYKDLLANRVEGIDNGLAIIEKLGLKDKILDEYNRLKPTANELREVNKFLNRILTLESYEQNTVFDGYSQRLQDATEKAMTDGTLDKGLENYKADKITLNEVQDIREDSRSGAKTKYYNLTAEHKIKPVKFEDIQTESKSFVGFYRNKNTGVVRAVMRTSSVTDQYGNVSDNYKLVGQVKNEYIPQYRLYGSWTEIKADEAETAWNEELTKLPEYRKENLHLISGVVLPVWDKLPTENVRIYRVLTSDGEMLIGRVVSEDMIDETLRRLGSARKREKIATKDLIAGIKNGDTVYLDNDWELVQSKVSGENRIELKGATYEHYELLKDKGVFSERIQFRTRFFVPPNTNTEKIIDDILKISPVYRVESKKYSVESEDYTNVQERSLLPNGSGEWSYSASTGKSTQKVDGRTSRYREGRTKANERRKYCQALKTAGNTREEIVHGHKCEVIPTEYYTSRMTDIAENNKKDGIDNTIFITGKAIIPYAKDSNGNPKMARGVFIKDNGITTVIVQYDNEFVAPEQINDHEKIHYRYHTPIVQKAKNVIMNNLSVADKNHILEKLSRDYNGIIEGNEEAIVEEFVANVLSEMDYEYSLRFRGLQKAFWKGDADSVDNFKVSEYTHSTDAGGVNSNVLGNIGFGDDTYLFDNTTRMEVFPQYDKYPYSDTGSRAMNWANSSGVKNFTKKVFYYLGTPYLVQKDTSVPEGYKIVKKVEINSTLDVKRYKEYKGEKNETYSRKEEVVRFDNEVGNSVELGRGNDGNDYSADEYARKGIEVRELGENDNQRRRDTDQRERTSEYGVGNRQLYIKYSFDSAERDIEELTPERRKEIDEQFEKDRAGFDKPTKKQLWGERAKWVAHNMTRVFPNIPERGEKGTFFAEFRKNMIQWTKLPQTASFMSQDKLNQMTRGLTPAEYKTFSELVYFLDLQEEAQIQKERGYTEILLPNEITPTEVDAIVKVLNEEATDNVKQALIKRQEIWNALKTQYIELNRYIGFDTDGKFKRKNYYHHQVIDYMNKGGKGTGNREISIKAGRGWLKERQGSTKAINTDFLAVEYQAMLQMQYDVYIAETLGKIKEQYDIKPQLEVEARNHNKRALNDIIRKEATDENGEWRLDRNGKPDSETYRQQMWYNSRIMMAFDGLFDLAERGELPTYDGEYAGVVEALKRNNLNAGGLYKYVGILANTDLPDNATDAQEQAVINARTVLKYTSQKREWVKSVLADDYQTWETIAKSMNDTHTIHQPRRGNYFYTKTIVDEDAFTKAYQEMVLSLASGDVDFGNEDINKLFAQYADTVRLMGVAYEQWVLPKEIVTTMSEIANPKQAGEIAKLSRSIITAWKGWSTGINPFRTVKYGTRNMLGDLDAVIAGKPQVVMYAKKAVQDIWQAMKHKNYSPEFMEWVERGGYTAMQYVNEMDVEMQDKLFSHLKEKSGINIFNIPLDILKGYANGVEAIHNFREAILRYSSYLYFKEAIKRNNGNVKDYVASNRYIVRGLNTVEDKAYQLSKDLLGAYDEVGKMGQTLRRYWVPFYSFAETNLKRYFRMFENVIMSDDKLPKKASKLLIKALMVNMLTLLFTAWNRLVMEEEDDKLPPSARNVPHITLGQNGDNVIAFTKPSSFSDILEWVGLEDYKWTEEDVTAPVDKAWGMITPFVKLPVELASGLNFYPSLTQPRAIRDKWQHFFNSWGVAGLYNEFTGKPTRGWGELAKGTFVYSYDYEESAYYEILDIKRKYQGDTDNTIYGTDKKSNALYYMKTAVKYKDEEVAYKYLDEYFDNGGTARGLRQSLSTLNPLYGFTSKDTYEKGIKFIASLTEEEKEKLKIAHEYYEKDLMMPEEVLALLGRKGVTEEDAKKIMKAYIKAKCKK